MNINWSHITGLFLRHLYPLRRDFDLASDMVYWPLVDTILWGVTSQWLSDTSGVAGVVVAILMGLVIWNVIWRSQSEISRNLMDEIWNNNLVNLFSTPLRVSEWVLGVLLLSVLKTLITLVVLVAAIFLLYSVNVFVAGWWLLVFFLGATMTGWWVGFISAGIVLRWGPKVQTVIWTLPAILLPLSAVFFPLDRLPGPVQWVSMIIPTTYIMEFMRALMAGASSPVWYLPVSFALNGVYLALTIWFFLRSFEYSRNLGLNRFN